MPNELITKKLSEGVLRQLKDLRNVNTYIVAVIHNDGIEIDSNAIISMNDLKAYDTVARTPEELTAALSTAGLTSIFIAAPISVDTFSASTGSALSIYGYPLQIEGNIASSATTPVKFFNVVNCTSSEFLNNADMYFRWLNGSVSKGLAANGAIYYENSSAILPSESFTFELWDNTVNFDHLPLASTSEYGVVKIAPDSDLGFDENGNLTLTVGQNFFKYLKIGIDMADASGSENTMEFVPSDDIEMSVSTGGIINLALAEIEGVEGSYGEDSDMAIQLDNGGSFNIPYLQISPTGRVIASKNVEFILPSLLGTVGEIDVTFNAGNITFSLSNTIKDLITENSDLLDLLIAGDSVTFYLDVVNGDDSNSGLTRSMPMKTVAAVVALARSMAGGDYFVRKYRLMILGEGVTISPFNGATHTNTVLFDTSDFISDPYVASSNLLPFQVITSEDRATSLIFSNSLSITGDALFIRCNGSVTVTNGSSLSVSGNVYVKAKNLTLTNAGKIGGGGDTIVDASGNLEMSYGGGINCGGDIVVNAKNITLRSSSISNGGSRYFRASRDLTVEYVSHNLSASSGITDIEAGNNILIRYLTDVPVSVGSTYPFNMRAGNDITIHSTDGLCNSKGNNIVAGGTVRIASTTIPYGANITAKNITDVIDEDIKGDVFIGQSLDKTMRWEAYDTIELYATLIANNNPSVGCYFKAYRMSLGGNFFRISGDVFLESYILQARYITNGSVSQDYPFNANTNLTVKTAILTHNHEYYANRDGFISIFEVTEDSRKNRVQVTADLITEDVQIAISGLFDAIIEANKIISTQLFYLNLDECVQNGCDRRVIDKSRLSPAYDVVIANRLGLNWHTGAYNMMAKDLKEALESPIVESIYLAESVSLDEDVVLGNDKILYGESLSYSGVMTGASTIKFFNHLLMNEGTFSCAEVYSRTVGGNLTIGGTCNFYYERILGGTATVGETASYSYNAWETETYAVADEETITGGAALGTDLKVLNAPVIRQPVFNNTEATISKGTPVAFAGTSGERVTIAKLISSTTITEQVNVGIVDADILPNMEGYAVRSGEITMDTNLWEEGDTLYASTTAGVLSTSRPAKGYGLIPVGIVIKKDGVDAGKVLVGPFPVPRISQLPDVDIVDPLPNQVLCINDDGLVENRFITNTVVQNLDGTINVEKIIGENGEDVYTLEGVESVPNINMTSSDSFLVITEDIDEETNTKTFDITVNPGTPTEKNYLNADSVITAHTSGEQYFEEFSIIDGDIPLNEEGWFIVPSGARLLDISVTLDIQIVGTPSPEYETVEFRIKNKDLVTYFMESRQVDWSLDHTVLTFQAKLKDINSLMFAFTSYNHDCNVYMTVRVNDESFLTIGDGGSSFIPSIRQLTDVDIVDPLPNQVLSIDDNGLVKNRFITVVAMYNVTENSVIDEEFNKGSTIVCYRGYSYAEYLPLIRRIPKSSYPDPVTYIYVFGAAHSGHVVEITCDPVDGWSVEENAYNGIPEAPDDGLSYARTSKAWNAIGSSIDITNDFELVDGMSSNDVGNAGRFRVIYIPSTDMVQIMGNFFSPSSKPYDSWVSCMKYTGDLLSFNLVAGSQMNIGLGAPPSYSSVRAIMVSAFIPNPNYSDRIFSFKGLIGYDNVPFYGVSAFFTCYGCRAAKLAEIAAAELANSGE